MNLQFYIEKLHDSEIFKQFISENPEAYFCSGFFTMDVSDGRDNQRHIDYYVPGSKQVVTFKLDSEVEKISPGVQLDVAGDFPVLEEIDSEIDFELKDVQRIIEEEIKKQNIDTKISKILVSLQKNEGKEFLVCTVFVSRFGLLRVNLDLNGKGGLEIVSFGRKSLFDFIKNGKSD